MRFDHDSDSSDNLATLRRLRGEAVVRQFCTIDIETTDWVNPYAVGFYDGTQYRDFIGKSCIADALNHVLTKEYAGRWIYAHNGGNFDFLFFLRALLTNKEYKRRYMVEITPVGSSLIRIQVSERDRDAHRPSCNKDTCRGCSKKRDGDGYLKWTFVDSVRLMPVKLNELGESFGIGKKVELKMSYNDLAKEANRPLMREYLKTDCTLLYQSISKMQNTIIGLGGQLGVTLPSTSLDVFRRKFQKFDIYTNRHFINCKAHGKKRDSSDKEACRGCMHEFIRDAYCGGRSEIFRMRFEPTEQVPHAFLYDFKAHYPSCMLEPMPTGMAIEVEGISEESVYKNAKSLVGIVDCDVEIPDDCYLPPLPVKHDGKLIFPTGRLSGKWDAAELVLLKQVGGRILRTRKSLWFETEPVFHRFVKALFKYRDKTLPGWNAGMDFIAKILLNSLYGKFGMREERNKIVISPDSPDGMTCIDMDSDVWSEDVIVSPQYIVPQLSVHVTSLARARLWEVLWKVVKAGGKIYYTDTDSVVCSGVKLDTGTDLGALTLESTITRAQFVLPKLYLIETLETSKTKHKEKNIKVKAKGMGPGIRLNEDGDDPYAGQLSQAEFLDLIQRGVPLERHRLTKFRESLRDYAKEALSFPRVISATKEIRTQYDKRLVMDDYDTKPVRLEHWQHDESSLPF